MSEEKIMCLGCHLVVLGIMLALRNQIFYTATTNF